MTDLLAARWQMGVSLGFHIIFACIGIAMPFLMVFAEWRWIKTGKEVYLDLAKAWAKGVAIFFAIGAVSGTVLAFELGLLWPTFMHHAGPIFGMPFSWEGTAFFLEAIALGLFLYGWKVLNKWVHLASGVVVGIAGTLSGIFVVAANGWMNAPSGFDWVNGEAINVDPVAAMFNDAWFAQAHHMTIAAYVAVGFGVAGVHALLLLRNPKNVFHQKAIQIALVMAAVAAILQPLSGDHAAKMVARLQPAKFAAMESHFKTEKRAALVLGGIPDEEKQEVNYAIRIPGGLSFLAHGDFDAEVIGLDQIPEDEQPPVLIPHLSFQFMVGVGMILALAGILFLLFRWKWKHNLDKRWWLVFLAILTPFGFLCVEVGWLVTEVGRQPWIIRGVMKTSEALTPMPGLRYIFYAITAVYVFLSFMAIWLLRRQIRVVNEKYNGNSK